MAIKDYKIVYDDSPAGLEAKVINAIDSGWQPRGEVVSGIKSVAGFQTYYAPEYLQVLEIKAGLTFKQNLSIAIFFSPVIIGIVANILFF